MTKDIIQNLKKRDSRTISRCISLVENQQDSYLEFLSSIFPYTGNAYRIGITGAPGSGKSTLVNLMLGLAQSTDGEIQLNYKNIWKKISIKFLALLNVLPL